MSNSTTTTTRVTKQLTVAEIAQMSGDVSKGVSFFAPGKFTATKVLDALCEGKPVKIVYDEPWFWQISLSRSAKPVEAPERKQKPKVEIDPVLGSGDQKRHRSGRKLTLDLSETNTVPGNPGNCPIKSRQQEHEKAVAKTIEEGEIAE